MPIDKDLQRLNVVQLEREIPSLEVIGINELTNTFVQFDCKGNVECLKIACLTQMKLSIGLLS